MNMLYVSYEECAEVACRGGSGISYIQLLLVYQKYGGDLNGADFFVVLAPQAGRVHFFVLEAPGPKRI